MPMPVSQYTDEMREIIDLFKREDPEGYEIFVACDLAMSHPRHTAMIKKLDELLERAARLLFENDREEARAAAIEVYHTMYLICGHDADAAARRKAEDLADAGGMPGACPCNLFC
jgi:uncharacterized protein YbaP (TraB family)